MTRQLFINAIHAEECRIAIAEDGHLVELEVERSDQIQLRGNIYKAAITRVEPSLQAAFVDIGSSKNGFLQVNDIHQAYYQNWLPDDRRPRPPIQDVLHSGQELVVQVLKDERDAKGATLSTNIAIPGRYLVLMIGSQRGGVSRKINDEAQRGRLKQAMQKLRVPAGMNVIVRTAGINKGSVELQRDLDSLLDIWFEIVSKSYEKGAPKLVYQESDLPIRFVRDYVTSDIDEIYVDDATTYERVRSFIERLMPNFLPRLKFYDSHVPLFTQFDLDAQVEETNHPEVILPSGGSIVFGITEAIVAIDVNSGRSTGNADVERTAFATNCEAARIIAEQLRLRDLGGLVVIDFIDMNDKRHQQTVEKTLREACLADKAKIEIGRISQFGLLEMSRQRLKSSLASQSYTTCSHCEGRGRVKTPESAAIDVLRKIQSAVFAGGISEVKIRMSPAAALLLLNSKRKFLTELEASTGSHIAVYADGRLRPDEYEFELQTHKNGETRTIDHRQERRPPQKKQQDRRPQEKKQNNGTRPENRQAARPQQNRNPAVKNEAVAVAGAINPHSADAQSANTQSRNNQARRRKRGKKSPDGTDDSHKGLRGNIQEGNINSRKNSNENSSEERATEVSAQGPVVVPTERASGE
jgi:ribonuclease E